ncbi:MAG: Pantothenate synthetase, partial [Bacteroidetes bacterium]|nr:Pantothenate synthetase [Bacteroidota bacterium]
DEMLKILSGGNPTNIDYIAFVHLKTFEEVQAIEPPNVLIVLAVRFGVTRLIDNAIVSVN